jgi:hypothetical protein
MSPLNIRRRRRRFGAWPAVCPGKRVCGWVGWSVGVSAGVRVWYVARVYVDTTHKPDEY